MLARAESMFHRTFCAAGWLTGCYPIGMAVPRIHSRRLSTQDGPQWCIQRCVCGSTIGKYAAMCYYIFFPETEHIDIRGEHGPDADAMERHRETYAHTKCVSFFHIIFCCHFFESQFVWRTHKLFSGFWSKVNTIRQALQANRNRVRAQYSASREIVTSTLQHVFLSVWLSTLGCMVNRNSSICFQNSIPSPARKMHG